MPDKSEMPQKPAAPEKPATSEDRAAAEGRTGAGGRAAAGKQSATAGRTAAEKQTATAGHTATEKRTSAGKRAPAGKRASAEKQTASTGRAASERRADGSEGRTDPGSQAGAPEGRTGAGAQAAAKEQPRRRQARGERRIAQLLEAAASVFCTTGYTAASTNAIAREAGVSPGTLYQFFPNKEAIAIELGDRLMHKMRETYGTALAPVAPATPLAEAVGGAVDRFMAFNTEHPEFFALMHGPDVPGRIADEHEALHAAMIGRVEALLDSFLADVPPADITRTAHVCLGIYKSGLELVLSHTGGEREAYVQEIKNVLVRYLQPLTGDPVGGPADAVAQDGARSAP